MRWTSRPGGLPGCLTFKASGQDTPARPKKGWMIRQEGTYLPRWPFQVPGGRWRLHTCRLPSMAPTGTAHNSSWP